MINDPDGNRTRVTAVKGRCLNRLTTGPLFSSSVAEPFLVLSYNFYNCKSFFLILSIFLLKFFTVFYDFLKLIFYSFFEKHFLRSIFYCFIFNLHCKTAGRINPAGRKICILLFITDHRSSIKTTVSLRTFSA